MNITMNTATLPASSDAAAAGQVAGAAPSEGLALEPALAAAQPGLPLPFLQFMQMDVVAGEPPAQPELAASDAAVDAAVPAAAEAQEEQPGTAAQAEPLLAAMSLPLMPSMMQMPAALPAAMRVGAGQPERQERAAEAAPVTAPAAAADAGGAGVELPATLAVRANAPAQAAQPAFEGAHAQMARTGAAIAQPGAALQQQQQQPAPAASPIPARDGANSEGQAANSGGGNNNGAANQAGFGIAASGAAAAPAAAPRDGGTLALSGPPTAWRQNLQEALGERLNLQVGRNAEQAVIRLEPPMLGRIEISIRHAAGSLEVNITATHSEVLRQLNTVSDNLRSDLAQRQYTDVSVNVSQATPRAQAGAQAQSGFGADAQGRGRQPGQDQDERAPGAALAEANQSTTAFSLSGRA
jgi:flagellar hook-length control protein FliK